jgi:hypothetical protein
MGFGTCTQLIILKAQKGQKQTHPTKQKQVSTQNHSFGQANQRTTKNLGTAHSTKRLYGKTIHTHPTRIRHQLTAVYILSGRNE